jgi:hypothetical protein
MPLENPDHKDNGLWPLSRQKLLIVWRFFIEKLAGILMTLSMTGKVQLRAGILHAFICRQVGWLKNQDC